MPRRDPMTLAVGRSVSLPIQVWEEIDAEADKQGRTRSDLVLEVWREWQARHQSNGGPQPSRVPEMSDPWGTGF